MPSKAVNNFHCRKSETIKPAMTEITSSDALTGDTPDEMKKYLYDVIARISGLHAVIITDRDGVPVLRAATDNTPEMIVKPSFLATVGTATDQAGKLGIGRSQTIICLFGKYQVIHFNRHPLMISLVASSIANTGLLLSLDSELETLVQELRTAVDAS